MLSIIKGFGMQTAMKRFTINGNDPMVTDFRILERGTAAMNRIDCQQASGDGINPCKSGVDRMPIAAQRSECPYD